MSISVGNDKLGEVPNISLRPVLDCANCESCKYRCYAKKFYAFYPGVKKSWDENFLLASRDPYTYFTNIIDYIRKNESKFFRWHVGGDILNQKYLDNMFLVAAICHTTKFTCFTKCFNLDYSMKPKNLRIYFSLWSGMDMPTVPDGVQLAWVQDKKETRIPATGVKHCPNKCENCMSCWKSSKDVVFHLHR